MVASRKQRGAGFFTSKPVQTNVDLDYSGKGLTTDDLGKKLVSEFPTQREMDRIFTLNVRDNNLVEMPAIPIQNLNSLECSNNKLRLISSSGEIPELRRISDLYPYLQSLYCDNNELSVLPGLPSSLDTLECNDNKLKVLPRLPEGLTSIVCHNNPFISPFKEYVAEFMETNDVEALKAKVNGYWAKNKLFGGRRNTKKSKKPKRKTRRV